MTLHERTLTCSRWITDFDGRKIRNSHVRHVGVSRFGHYTASLSACFERLSTLQVMLIKTTGAHRIDTPRNGQSDVGFVDGGDGSSGYCREGEEQSKQQQRSEHPGHWKVFERMPLGKPTGLRAFK